MSYINNSNASLFPNLIFYELYASAAFIGTVLNLLLFASIVNDSNLRRGSALFIGLICAHIINSTASTISGFYKRLYVFRAAVPLLVHPSYCVKIIFVPLCMLGYQIVSVMLVLVSLERLLALAAPIWFRVQWRPTRSLMATIAAFGCCILAMIGKCAEILLKSHTAIHFGCLPELVFGEDYVKYGVHVPATMCGIIATTFTASAIYIGRRRLQKLPQSSSSERARIKRQIRLSQCMFAVACIDVAFVVGPNIALIWYNSRSTSVPPNIMGVAITLFGFDSILNVFTFIFLNTEFRNGMKKMLTCKKQHVVHAAGLAIPHGNVF